MNRNLADLTQVKCLKCPFTKCNATIISYNNLSPVKVENSPQMLYPSNYEPSNEVFTDFFRINDVWDFDNIGVSRPSDELKQPKVSDSSFTIERLLICSECDRGPLGFAGHEQGETDVSKLIYFLSCESVLYS